MGSEPQYISLKEATQYCDYSQDYLSLRARQKKLKAIKKGRNWVTTKEWLSDYIQQSQAYQSKRKPKEVVKQIDPPTNLPVYAPEADMLEDNQPEEIALQVAFIRKVEFSTAIFLAALLTGGAILLGQEEFVQVAHTISLPAYTASVGAIMQEYFQWLQSFR